MGKSRFIGPRDFGAKNHSLNADEHGEDGRFVWLPHLIWAAFPGIEKREADRAASVQVWIERMSLVIVAIENEGDLRRGEGIRGKNFWPTL